MRARWQEWQDLSRMFTGHVLTAPLHHLFNRLPHWEYGLARPQLTRLHCTHARLAGRRAVHLTDLHLDRYQIRHDKTIRIVADLKPDWIFITGDLLNVRSGLPSLFRFLAGLRWIAPLYMTLGNHDHYSGVPVDEFASLADRHKITLLVNQTTTLQVNGGELAFWLPPGCAGKVGGLYEVGRHRLYVNRGLGWSALPLRWNCPPEVLLIEWKERVTGQSSSVNRGIGSRS